MSAQGQPGGSTLVTSSAESDRLAGYPAKLTEAKSQLTTLATDLDEKMSAFATGTGAFLPAGFDAVGDGSEAAFDGLAKGVGTAGGVIAAAGGIAAFAVAGTAAAPIISTVGATTWMGFSLTSLAIPGMASDAPIPGNDIQNIVLDQLRQDMAVSVAAANGWAAPSTPEEYLATLDRAYPGTGDPFEYIDIPG